MVDQRLAESHGLVDWDQMLDELRAAEYARQVDDQAAQLVAEVETAALPPGVELPEDFPLAPRLPTVGHIRLLELLHSPLVVGKPATLADMVLLLYVVSCPSPRPILRAARAGAVAAVEEAADAWALGFGLAEMEAAFVEAQAGMPGGDEDGDGNPTTPDGSRG
jgi:hypothetical protein